MTDTRQNSTLDYSDESTNCGPDTKLEVKSIEISCCVTTIHVVSLLSTSNIENVINYTDSMFTQPDWQAFGPRAAKPTTQPHCASEIPTNILNYFYLTHL